MLSREAGFLQYEAASLQDLGFSVCRVETQTAKRSELASDSGSLEVRNISVI